MAKLAEDKTELGKRWRKWRRELFDAVLAGPYGDAARATVTVLETLTLENTDELVTTIAAGPWAAAPASARSVLLERGRYGAGHRARARRLGAVF